MVKRKIAIIALQIARYTCDYVVLVAKLLRYRLKQAKITPNLKTSDCLTRDEPLAGRSLRS